MANPHRGEVSFDADGRSYMLRYSTNAICDLEDKLDRSFVSISGDLAKAVSNPEGLRISTLRAIFWAGLRDHQPDISIKDAGELMIDVGGAAGALVLISEAFVRAFPAPESKGARPPQQGMSPSGNGVGLTS